MRWIVAYDIADPKRLSRVAKEMERHAQRVQKSVFTFSGSRISLKHLISQVERHIDPLFDRVQAWPLAQNSELIRENLGATMENQGYAIVATPGQITLLREPAIQTDQTGYGPEQDSNDAFDS